MTERRDIAMVREALVGAIAILEREEAFFRRGCEASRGCAGADVLAGAADDLAAARARLEARRRALDDAGE